MAKAREQKRPRKRSAKHSKEAAPLVKLAIKAPAGYGGTFEIGAGVLAVLDHLKEFVKYYFPNFGARARAKAALRNMALTGATKRAKNGQALSQEDVDVIQAYANEIDAKWICQAQIAAKAIPLIQESVPRACLGSPEHEVDLSDLDKPATSPDWIARFWDDAGLVSDDDVQVIYARILADEVKRPGTLSMQTLRVLKYLDHDAALVIAKVAPFVVNGAFIPRAHDQRPHWAITFEGLEVLDDAGVVDSSIMFAEDVDPAGRVFEWGQCRLALDVEIRQQIPTFRLTRAGRDIFRIAHVERTEELFFKSAIFLRRLIGEPGRARATWTADPSLPREKWRELEYDPRAPML